MNKLAKIIFISGCIFSVLLIITGFFVYKKYSKGLPNYQQLKEYQPMITTRLYAIDGSLVSEFSKEKRIFVPISAIPQNLINAFLAAEDANFYRHSGVDPVAISRAVVNNIIAKIKGVGSFSGASTITQQVVKNFLLTHERTLTRKIKEAILAVRMTQAFSKDQVLELYLNQIYLGSGSYGVAAAAQVYFNKSIDELEIEEAALLATLPKAPSKLDPRKNIKKAKIRRNWVIDRMMKEKFITEEEAKIAKESPIILQENHSQEYTKADFFADSVKKELTKMYGSDNVFESGIVVSTTLDPRLQKIARKAFQAGIENYDKKHGWRGVIKRTKLETDWLKQVQNFEIKKLYPQDWKKAIVLSTTKDQAKIGIENADEGIISLESIQWAKRYIDVDTVGSPPNKVSDIIKKGDIILVQFLKEEEEQRFYDLKQIPAVNGSFLAMDPHTGRVLAMMGGYVDAPNQFNRTTQAMRQPGSIMKTFSYLAALENGYTPASIVIDEEISLDQGYDQPPYKPTNYTNEYYGPTTLRIGLEKSRNVATVRMADQVGIDNIVDVVKRFGINDDPKKIYSLVLGSTETNVMKLMRAYSMIINGGKKVSPAIIEKIQDRTGKTIYRRDKRICENCMITKDSADINMDKLTIPILAQNQERITDPATAYQTTYMLQGVAERGTAVRAKWGVGKIIGGKTGTTNSSIDSWFVGFSPDLIAGVYVGFDTPKTLGKRETGASIALPIFTDFMKEALKDKPSTPFRVPGNIKFVKINRLTGKLATPQTPAKDIFFEAFKLDDKIENDNQPTIFEFEDEENKEEFDDNASDSDPVGIY